jgi:hypothetical protein
MKFNADMAEPSRAKLRMLQELPKWLKSRTDNCASNFTADQIEAPLPNRVNALVDKVEPNRASL